jgi:hypothetical protein
MGPLEEDERLIFRELSGCGREPGKMVSEIALVVAKFPNSVRKEGRGRGGVHQEA